MTVTGRAWVFGDDVDTDVLAPGAYMKGGIEALAAHCLEAIDPQFAAAVRPGDVVVAGRNFGVGSSREQAAEALKVLGVSAVVAVSFAGIFYRNAINLGLPAFTSSETGLIKAGEPVTLDIDAATLTLSDTGKVLTCEPLPGFLLDMIHDGGLVAHLEKKLKGGRPAA